MQLILLVKMRNPRLRNKPLTKNSFWLLKSQHSKTSSVSLTDLRPLFVHQPCVMEQAEPAALTSHKDRWIFLKSSTVSTTKGPMLLHLHIKESLSKTPSYLKPCDNPPSFITPQRRPSAWNIQSVPGMLSASCGIAVFCSQRTLLFRQNI